MRRSAPRWLPAHPGFSRPRSPRSATSSPTRPSVRRSTDDRPHRRADRARPGRRRRSPCDEAAGTAPRAGAAIRLRSRWAIRGDRARVAGGRALPPAGPRRERRGSRGCCCGGTRADRRGGAADGPRGSRGAGRTRCSRRTPRPRDRSSPRRAERPLHSPRRAGTRSRTRPGSAGRWRAAPESRRRRRDARRVSPARPTRRRCRTRARRRRARRRRRGCRASPRARRRLPR